MMNEYVATLQKRALAGDTAAMDELNRVLSYRDSVQQSTQQFASRMRSQGADVQYRQDGGLDLDFSRYGDREEIVVRWPNGGEAPIEGGTTRAETDEIIRAMNASYEREGVPQRAYRKGATQETVIPSQEREMRQVFKRDSSSKPKANYLDGESKSKAAGAVMAIAKGGSFWWLKPLVYFCAGLVGMFLLYRSFGLYQTAFNRFGLGGIKGVCTGLGLIPVLGSGISQGCATIADFLIGILALIVLLTLSSMQAVPTLIYFSPGSIRKMVHQLRANRRSQSTLDEQSDDTPEVRGLIKRHNELSAKALKTLLIFSVLAFAAEAAIVWFARSGRADVMSVLIDSLALDLLLVAVLAFGNAFHAKPQKVRQYGA